MSEKDHQKAKAAAEKFYDDCGFTWEDFVRGLKLFRAMGVSAERLKAAQRDFRRRKATSSGSPE